MVLVRSASSAFILLSSKTFYQWLKDETYSFLAVGMGYFEQFTPCDKGHRFEDLWVDLEVHSNIIHVFSVDMSACDADGM